jgi:glycosyltransferase XagB
LLKKTLGQSSSIRGHLVRYQQVEWRSIATSPSIGGATTDSKLPSDAPDVLPLLEREVLEDTLRRLPPQAIRRALRHGVVPVAWRQDHLLYATCDPKGGDYARRHGLSVVSRIKSSDFHPCARRIWGRKILRHATYGLSATRPQFSARRRVTLAQMAAFFIFASYLALSFAYLPVSAVWFAASALLGMFFLSVVALRLFCLFPVPPARYEDAINPDDAELPTYSILVPVFRETAVLPQLLRSLSCLNYPVLCRKRRKIICEI